MKKTVLTFGLVGGAILAAMMFAALPFLDKIGFDKGEIIGYTTMVLAFMVVFFGVRSYRENVGGGQISLARPCSKRPIGAGQVCEPLSIPQVFLVVTDPTFGELCLCCAALRRRGSPGT